MTPNDVRFIAENIEDFIEVPNSIERLRKAFFTLATSGKLVPQQDQDGNAEELYKQILLRRKHQLPKKGRGLISENPIDAEIIPFDIPSTWKWVQLSAICDINPRNSIEDSTEVTFLPMARIHSGWNIDPDTDETRLWNDVKSGFTHIAENDVILAKITPCFENGKAGVARNLLNNYAAGTTELHVFRGGQYIDPDYLLAVFNTPYFVEDAIKNMTGTAGQKRLPTDYVSDIFIPLPPFKEQRRIVDKLNEIMKKLDDLESEKQERDEVRTRFIRSAMYSLGKGDTKIVLENITELIKTPEDLKELENAVLTLAVSGKLVPQDSSESTAHDLYLLIKRELNNNQARSNQVKLKLYIKKEPPFEIPASWKWVYLGEILNFINGYAFKSSEYQDKGVGLVRIGDIQDGRIQTSKMKFLDSNLLSSFNSSMLVKPGDLVIAMSGATTGKLGFNTTNETFLLNQRVGKLEVDKVESGYIYLYLVTKIKENLSISSGSAIPNLSSEQIKNILIPLPPLAEQKRIIHKVSEVRPLLNKLQQFFSN